MTKVGPNKYDMDMSFIDRSGNRVNTARQVGRATALFRCNAPRRTLGSEMENIAKATPTNPRVIISHSPRVRHPGDDIELADIARQAHEQGLNYRLDAQFELGTNEQAAQHLEPFCKETPDNPNCEVLLALADAVLGKRDSALREAERAIMLSTSPEDQVPGGAYEELLALIQTVLGQNSRAISTLTRLLKKPYVTGPAPITPALLRLDPLWDLLRGDPAFQKLCEEKQPPATP